MSSGGLRGRVPIPRYRRYLRDEVLNALQPPPLIIPVVSGLLFLYFSSLLHYQYTLLILF